MHEIADRLHQGTTLGMIAELGPGEIRQAVGFAIPTTEQIDERLDRQVVQRVMRGRRRNCVGPAAVLDEEITANGHQPRGRADHMADIAEAVAIFPDRDLGMQVHLVGRDEIGAPHRMHAHGENHGRGLRALIRDLVTCPNFHRHPPGPAIP
jgi:hypothetical protein